MFYDSDIDLECDYECGQPSPPIFNIPPPPRPEFLQSESESSITCLGNDFEMCEAIPVSF